MPFNAVGDDILQSLKAAIAEKFENDCRILGALEIPDDAFDPQRKQYASTPVLREIVATAPADTKKILGVVDVDLCVPILTFVFGRAQMNGKAAVVSLFRLRQEYYGLTPNPDLLRARASKEAMHELGHTFGLTHCADCRCVMYLSNSVRNIDIKARDFCEGCSGLLSAFKL